MLYGGASFTCQTCVSMYCLEHYCGLLSWMAECSISWLPFMLKPCSRCPYLNCIFPQKIAFLICFYLCIRFSVKYSKVCILYRTAKYLAIQPVPVGCCFKQDTLGTEADLCCRGHFVSMGSLCQHSMPVIPS